MTRAILGASNIKLTPPTLVEGLTFEKQINEWKTQVLDRTKTLYGPRTQAFGETNYLEEKHKCWTEPRPCMVLGLKPLEKPIT